MDEQGILDSVSSAEVVLELEENWLMPSGRPRSAPMFEVFRLSEFDSQLAPKMLTLF